MRAKTAAGLYSLHETFIFIQLNIPRLRTISQRSSHCAAMKMEI